MPTFTEARGRYVKGRYVESKKRLEYATEEELLEFASKVRQAGGANPITALMPSEQGEPSACLIANALNFDCRVEGIRENPSGGYTWGMWPCGPPEVVQELARKLSEATGCELTEDGEGIVLPPKIGNAADAFDNASRGWVTKYRKPDEDED